MKLKFCLFLLMCFTFITTISSAQFFPKTTFTHADTLRGSLTPLRTCYDINFYHLDVQFNLDKRFISGSNQFQFTATQNFSRLQFDLFANLQIEKIMYHHQSLPYTRNANAVFVTFPNTIKKGNKDEFTVFYSGNPAVLKDRRYKAE